MRLSREKFKGLSAVLVAAFGDKSELRLMVREGLGERLAEIVTEGTLDNMVLDLIEWAENTGRVEELVLAARTENPGNPELKAFQLEETLLHTGKSSRLIALPSHRNIYYLENGAMLAQIDSSLQQYGRVVLHGVAGAGKSRSAYEFADRFGEPYAGGVVWIQADTPDAVLDSLSALAENPALGLTIRPEMVREERVQIVRQRLAACEKCLLLYDNMDWLFDLDGADFQRVLQEDFPVHATSHLLITSRLSGGGHALFPLPHKTLSQDEAALLLLRYAHQNPALDSLDSVSQADVTAARQLAELLDAMPLALAQAGATVAESDRMTLQSYLKDYQSEQGETLRQRVSQYSTDLSVYQTYVSAMEDISERNSDVVGILALSAMLASAPIPRAVFTPPIFSETIQQEFETAVDMAVRYRLLESDKAAQTVLMPRVVRDVVQDVLPDETRDIYKRLAVGCVANVFPTADYPNWKTCAALLPHALAGAEIIRERDLKTESAVLLLNQAALYLSQQQREDEALPLYEKALALCDQLEEPNLFLKATCLNNIGTQHFHKREFKESLPILQRALAIQRKLPKPGHPDTPVVLNNMGLAFMYLGDFDKSLSHYQRALPLSEKMQGSESALTAQILNNLGLLTFYRGDFEQALFHYQRAEAVCRKTLGIEHPQTAQLLNNLAFLHFRRGANVEAETLFRESIEIYEKTLGPGHPEYTNALALEGMLSASRGETERAISIFKRALDSYDKMRRPNPEDIARAQNYLAVAYFRKGEFDQSQTLYEQALIHFTNAFGPKHPERALVLNNMGMLFLRGNALEQAEAHFTEALTIYEETLKGPQPILATIYDCMGQLYFQQKKPEEAETAFLKALDIAEKTVGPENYMVASSLCNLGVLYATINRLEEADKLLDRALPMSKKVIGPEPTLRAQCLTGKALVFLQKKELEPAKEWLQQAVSEFEAKVGLLHPEAIQIINTLAILYAAEDDFDSAIALLEPVYTAKKDLLGEQHAEVIPLSDQLARLREAKEAQTETEMQAKSS